MESGLMHIAVLAFIAAGTCAVLVYQDVRDRKWFDAAFFGFVGVVSAVVGVFVWRFAELARIAGASR